VPGWRPRWFAKVEVPMTEDTLLAQQADHYRVPLPMAIADCTLSPDALGDQLERYRRLGSTATRIERHDRRFVITFGRQMDTELLERAIEVERECCSFLALDYDDSTRGLSVAAGADRVDALDAVLAALTSGFSIGG
jgi:hypothetical protein